MSYEILYGRQIFVLDQDINRTKPTEKKYQPCLGGCGRDIYTDSSHRFCGKCREKNNKNRRKVGIVDSRPATLLGRSPRGKVSQEE